MRRGSRRDHDRLCALAQQGSPVDATSPKARYLPDRHTLSSKELELELVCEPWFTLRHTHCRSNTWKAPAATTGPWAEGPSRVSESLRPPTRCTEIGNWLTSLQRRLLRQSSESANWESVIEELRSLVARRDANDVLGYVEREVRPLLSVLPDDESGGLGEILDDLANAVRDGLT